MDISVLNLNTYVYPTIRPSRKERLRILGQEVSKISPDILTLQEMDFETRSFNPLQEGLGQEYNLHGVFHKFLFKNAATSGLGIATKLKVKEFEFIPFKENLSGLKKGIVKEKGFLYIHL